MGYNGSNFKIQMGLNGLHTDDAQDLIPPDHLIEAKNITLVNGIVEKDRGSRKWNPSFPLPAAIKCLLDYFPTEAQQRLISICSDGKIYKQYDGYSSPVEITPVSPAPATINTSNFVHMVLGGNESASSSRKVFVFDGISPVQVISGDNNTRSNITTPALDWTGTNQPSFGIIHRGRLWAFGNVNNPHTIYASMTTNHQNFTDATALVTQVYPGEGDRLFTAWVFKGRMFVAKSPRNIYFLVDTDPDTDNWYFTKLNTNFGVASPHSTVEALDDMLIANNTGSITSASAAFQLGEIKAADVMNNLRVERYMRENTSQTSLGDRWGIYYEDKKQVYFTYRSPSATSNDRILIMDLSNQKPKISWSYKDQPNCLALRRDMKGVLRPIYGANDGYVYSMDSEDRDVGGSAYEGKFQTPHIDLGSTIEKHFDFLEVTFEPTGSWDITVTPVVDGVPQQVMTFDMHYGSVLDQLILDKDILSGRIPRSLRKPIDAKGRTISFIVSNSGLRQNFRIQSLTVYFRPAGQGQRNLNK